jgi:hypothetical protein
MDKDYNTKVLEEMVEIERIGGVEGDCIAINSYRVAGNKPWSGGTTKQEWKTTKKQIMHSIGFDDFSQALSQARQEGRMEGLEKGKEVIHTIESAMSNEDNLGLRDSQIFSNIRAFLTSELDKEKGDEKK